MGAKSLFYIGIYPYLRGGVTDSGLLKKIVDSGKKFHASDSTEYAAHVSKDGKKVRWVEGAKIPADQSNQPMLFGYFARFENLNAALTGEVDELALKDKAM